jgi:hypothetical protein
MGSKERDDRWVPFVSDVGETKMLWHLVDAARRVTAALLGQPTRGRVRVWVRARELGRTGWRGRPRGALFLFLIYSKSFSILYFLHFNYAKHLYINKYIYCLHLYNKMGSTKYIFDFQPFSKVIITYSFNLINSLNKIDYF